MSEVVATVVQDSRPGLSGAEAALYGAIIAGAFTLLGVVIERILRLMGFLRFEAYEWERRFTGALNNRNEYSEIDVDKLSRWDVEYIHGRGSEAPREFLMS